jgi:hypothetical protein
LADDALRKRRNIAKRGESISLGVERNPRTIGLPMEEPAKWATAVSVE